MPHPVTHAAQVAGRIVALLGVLGFTACAALPWPQARFAPPAAERNAQGLLDLRGVVHVHTRASHDSPGLIEDVLRAARNTGVSWVALAEHTNPGGPPAKGTLDGVVFIPGYELRAWGGSLLAIGIERLPADTRDTLRAIAEIHRSGGVAFAAHLDTSRISAEDWRATAPDGLEIANLHANALETNPLTLALATALLPGPWMLRLLLRTPVENLQRWETLPDADAIVGGSDIHAKFRVLGPLGGTIDGYSRMFRLLTTHVLAREATSEAILEALRAGRSYVAYEGRGRVDHFGFERQGNAFELSAPRRARLALVCDGARQEEEDVATTRFAIPQGATRCRGEAWLSNQLWIVTSYERVSP